MNISRVYDNSIDYAIDKALDELEFITEKNVDNKTVEVRQGKNGTMYFIEKR